MDTPPMVTDFEVARCIALIRARREKHGDRNVELMPDDPAGVLDYLRKYSGTDIPLDVRRADALAALTLSNKLKWDDRARERWALKWAVGLDHHLSTVGSEIGVKSRQGTRDRIDRLDALLTYYRPDANLIRERRRVDATEASQDGLQRDWIQNHSRELRGVVAAMVKAADQHQLSDEQREWIDELARDSREASFTRGSIAVLGLAVGDLLSAPAILALGEPEQRAIHAAARSANRIRSEFSELGKRAARS